MRRLQLLVGLQVVARMRIAGERIAPKIVGKRVAVRTQLRELGAALSHDLVVVFVVFDIVHGFPGACMSAPPRAIMCAGAPCRSRLARAGAQPPRRRSPARPAAPEYAAQIAAHRAAPADARRRAPTATSAPASCFRPAR